MIRNGHLGYARKVSNKSRKERCPMSKVYVGIDIGSKVAAVVAREDITYRCAIA